MHLMYVSKYYKIFIVYNVNDRRRKAGRAIRKQEKNKELRERSRWMRAFRSFPVDNKG